MLNVCCNLFPAGVGEGIEIPDFIKLQMALLKQHKAMLDHSIIHLTVRVW